MITLLDFSSILSKSSNFRINLAVVYGQFMFSDNSFSFLRQIDRIRIGYIRIRVTLLPVFLFNAYIIAFMKKKKTFNRQGNCVS